MNTMEKKIAARSATVNALMQTLNGLDAVQFGDANFAVLQEIDGQEIWTEISFDPFEVAQEWQEEKELKAREKEAKRKEKEAKIARDEAEREAKRKAKGEE